MATIFPASDTIAFVPRDTVVTNGSGVAVTQLKILPSRPIPDSVVVTVKVTRPDGTPIPVLDSFVVVFQP